MNYDRIHKDGLYLRQNLALLYNMIADMGLDDLIYTHASARLNSDNEDGDNDTFYICRFGDAHSEVHPDDLLEYDFSGKVVNGAEGYNKTGFAIHQGIYKNRPDINAIVHLHTPEIVAISSLKCGLLPISQFALPFYKKMSYYSYDSLVTDPKEQGDAISSALGMSKTMLMENHGSITCGSTIGEAFYFTRFLQNACNVQCKILATGRDYIMPTTEVREKTSNEMLRFEENLGQKDWEAAKRLFLKRNGLSKGRDIHRWV